ncbi:hypothetical protein [Cryobacterium sp. Y50]|uniref:AtuA-related protein n=1 Tax=Cryobacterium sp. Y50 TaxID=2048286 RepID=UPI000CE4F015|nr:hypothetical protein [Cryobacterium sp. Y50]
MTVVVSLDLLADVRTGDKGDTLILAVLPRDDAAYRHLLFRLTPAVVSSHFGRLVIGDVRRTVMPQLPGFVFELPGVLGGGVTGSPSLDGHGKTLSYHLLSLKI